MRLSKITMQNRARKVVLLARLDLDGSPHVNPDGQKIVGDHLHLFKESFGDKWAQPLDTAVFQNPSDPTDVFTGFCRVCQILDAPPLQVTLA